MIDMDMVFAATALLALVIVTGAALVGWQGWLTLKARELDIDRESRAAHPGGSLMANGSPEGMARIEIADLKERIRKLEAIASGVDL